MKYFIPFIAIFSAHLSLAAVTSFNCASTEYAANLSVIAQQTVIGQPSLGDPGTFENVIANLDQSVTFDGIASDPENSIPYVVYTVTDTSVNPPYIFAIDGQAGAPLTYDYQETNGGIFEVHCDIGLSSR